MLHSNSFRNNGIMEAILLTWHGVYQMDSSKERRRGGWEVPHQWTDLDVVDGVEAILILG
jgi:hypothetical protein